MAAVSASCLRFQASFKLAIKPNQIFGRRQNTSICLGWARTGFPPLRTCHFRVTCAAKAETVQKVSDIVRKQLALSPETELTPQTTFIALGADSLDTVEIIMGLEEEFNINVEEENQENVTTIQEAADLIEKLVQMKAQA